MKQANKKDFYIYLLSLVYMIPFFVLVTANTLFSLFQTTYMELYLDTEKPLYKADSPILLLILTVVFIGLCILLFRKKEMTPKFCNLLEKTSLIWTVVLCLFIIFLFRVRVACDSASLSDLAIAFLNGDYSSFSGDNYLAHYPHQLGMIAFLQIIYYIFGVENFIVLQLLNVVAIFSVVFFFHRITEELFHNLQIQALLSVLCMGMLPLFLYSTFIYGDIPGLGFVVPAIYLVIRYLNTSQKKLLIPAFLCMTFAVVFKSNNSVILVAVILLLILKMFQDKDFFAFVFAVVVFLGPALINTGIDAYYADAAGLDKIPNGVPKIAWVAMGLQENEYIENGWYNGYNWSVYTKHAFDAEKTTHECLESIKESINSFLSAPKSGLHFFYKKFISQWNDPGYQAQITNEWYSRHRDDHSDLALYLIYGDGRLILEEFMNIYHFLVLLGSSIFAFCSLREKQLSATLLPLCVFGGYFFHLIWEAGGRYGLGYFVLCVPMAARGIWTLTQIVPTILNKYFKNN